MSDPITERIASLQDRHREIDYCVDTIRRLMRKGLSDDDIVLRFKNPVPTVLGRRTAHPDSKQARTANFRKLYPGVGYSSVHLLRLFCIGLDDLAIVLRWVSMPPHQCLPGRPKQASGLRLLAFKAEYPSVGYGDRHIGRLLQQGNSAAQIAAMHEAYYRKVTEHVKAVRCGTEQPRRSLFASYRRLQRQGAIPPSSSSS